MTHPVLIRASAPLAVAIALVLQGTGPALAQPPRHDYRRPPPYHYHYGYAPNNAGAAIAGGLLGLGVGAVLGSALASSAAPPPPAYYPAPPPPAYYSAPPPAYYGYGY